MVVGFPVELNGPLAFQPNGFCALLDENNRSDLMTVEVRRDEAGGCVADIGGEAALEALEERAAAGGMSVPDLVLSMVREELRLLRRVNG